MLHLLTSLSILAVIDAAIFYLLIKTTKSSLKEANESRLN